MRRQATLADYTGELSVEQIVQITDRLQRPRHSSKPATVQANPFRLGDPLRRHGRKSRSAARARSSRPSTRSLPGAVVEGKRAIWELKGIDVFDGGADDQAATTSGNTLFARQGLFVP